MDRAVAEQIGWQIEYDLGVSLMQAGRFSEALEALREAQHLASKIADPKTLLDEVREQLRLLAPQLDECARLAELDVLLARVRDESVTVTDPVTALELSAFALRRRDCPRTAVQLAEGCWRESPRWPTTGAPGTA